MQYEVDLQVSLDGPKDWDEINTTAVDVASKFGLEHDSAGTGLGVRDMQFPVANQAEGEGLAEALADAFGEQLLSVKVVTVVP